MTSETRITILRETSVEGQTVATIGCDRCPKGRMVLAQGMGGMMVARCLTGRVPYEASTIAQVKINGAEGPYIGEKTTSYANTQPGLQACPPDQCGYPEEVPRLATELQAALTNMGLHEVKNVADPRPR